MRPFITHKKFGPFDLDVAQKKPKSRLLCYSYWNEGRIRKETEFKVVRKWHATFTLLRNFKPQIY